MPQAARLHFKARSADPLADQAQLVSLVLVFGLLVDSIRFISFRFVVLFYFVVPRFVLFLFQIFELLHLLVNVLSFIAFNELRNTHTLTHNRSPFRGVSIRHVAYT